MRMHFSPLQRLLMLLFITVLTMPVMVSAQQGLPTGVRLEPVVESGLAAPVDLDQPNDDSGRMFVVDQVGIIYVIDSEGSMVDTPFLDIRDRIIELNPSYDERGLLGLALHPDFANNGRFFVYYSAPLAEDAPSDWNHTSHLSEFTVSADDMNVADAGSERILMTVNQPQSNHNAGDIQFGPDGYLFVPLGDGGNRDDEGVGHTDETGNAQDMSKLLGKLLRIDVDSGDPYGIPSDNPYANDDTIPGEIWASGFRNPWRMSYDDQVGWIVSDLGQDRWEEVHTVSAGENAGWHVREASQCFSAEYPLFNPIECAEQSESGDAFLAPVIQYSHEHGIAIIGGHMYRGEMLPDSFQGTYVFGDWSTSFGQPDGKLMVAQLPPEEAPDSMWNFDTLRISNTDSQSLERFLLAIGNDNDGELYALTSELSGPDGDTGAVWRLVAP